MSDIEASIEGKYRQVYEEELIGLRRRRERDPELTVTNIEGTLKNLYIMDGNNWEGRSEILQAAVSATIAAHEYFISEWKKEQ